VKLTSFAALAILGLGACGDDQPLGANDREPPPDIASLQSAATVSVPVTVVNTAQVAGTVGLAAGSSVAISGTPGVNVLSMPLVAGTVTCQQSAPYETTVLGTPSVNVVSMPKVEVAGTPNVNVVSIPKVEVTGTTSTNVVSMPKVEVAGTPNVNVVSIPKVELAGTPTVNVANLPGSGATTTLVSQQRVTVDAFAFRQLDAVDVSTYRDVRVIATGTGFTDFQLFTFVVDETGQGRDLLLENDIIGGTGEGTRLYTVPGRKIRVLLIGSSSGSSDVTVSVFGRG
jgi:hypothetical protein